MASSSSSTRKKEPKLSARNQTRFKKSSYSWTKNRSLLLRETTILKKAFELSTLCDNEVCVIHYDRNGELVSTWPEDQSKVRDMAERFSKLSVQEKLKKSTNLSQFLNKKLLDEKKRSLYDENENIRFTQKVLDFEGTLVNRLQILQERVREIRNSEEPEQSRLAVISEQNHNFPVSRGFFSKDVPSSSSSLNEDPWKNLCPYDHLQQQRGSSTNLFMSGGDVSITSTEQDMSRVVYNSAAETDSSNHQRQNKFSIFAFNHETATFTQLRGSSSSSFDQTYALTMKHKFA